MGDQGLFAGAWAFFTKFIVPWLPHVTGSALALQFLKEGISGTQRLFSFASGVACAYYGAPALIEWFGIEGQHVSSVIGFFVGLFGLAIVRELFKELNDLNLLQALRDKWLGKKDAS